jgi:NAD(P)-dependent dehydrogenase (short-subunit alcohol dehydrogenase family)
MGWIDGTSWESCARHWCEPRHRRVTAYELASRDAHVVVVAKGTKDSPNATSPETIEETAARVRGLSFESLAIQADISREADIDAVRDAIELWPL